MKSERRPPSPDVIVLSDNEQPSSPRVNGLTKMALKETSTEALLVSLVVGGPPLFTLPLQPQLHSALLAMPTWSW